MLNYRLLQSIPNSSIQPNIFVVRSTSLLAVLISELFLPDFFQFNNLFLAVLGQLRLSTRSQNLYCRCAHIHHEETTSQTLGYLCSTIPIVAHSFGAWNTHYRRSHRDRGFFFAQASRTAVVTRVLGCRCAPDGPFSIQLGEQVRGLEPSPWIARVTEGDRGRRTRRLNSNKRSPEARRERDRPEILFSLRCACDEATTHARRG